MAKCEAWLQIEPRFLYGRPDVLRSIQAVALTRSRPRRPRGGTILIRLTLDIDDRVFKPIQPAIEVRVPANHVELVQVTSEPVEVPSDGP